MKKSLAIVAMAIASAFADETPADSAFSSLSVSIEGGEVYPFGSLIDDVENAYYAGVGVRYSYWEDFDGVAQLNYSYFKPVPEDVIVYGAHQFSGTIGLDWKGKWIRPVMVGAGFLCDFVRGDSDEKLDSATFKKQGGTLLDNETEFGWYARINVPFMHLDKFRMGLNIMWQELWTKPNRSDMLTAGIYIERKLW